MPAGTGTGGTPTSTSPNWFKKNWLGLSAGVIATIALVVGMNNCSGNSDRDARIDDVAANVDSLTVNQTKIIEVVQNHETRIQNNATAINNLKSRMDNAESDISDLQDSIAVHRTEIDSLKMGVDSIAKLQQKCPCVKPKAAKKSVKKRPARPNVVPVCRDTIATQVASGCGSNQNAAVVIGNNSSNNTVIINNGAGNVEATKAKPDTITQSWTAKGQVTVVVARRGYCR